MRITKTMGEVNRSLNNITDDVDALSHETEKSWQMPMNS